MNEIEQNLTEGMNDPQKIGTLHTEGHSLIMAGAGSGKTRVLTHRIANLVLNKHVKPSEITAITFTNKAAAEMRERLGKLIGEDQAMLANVATFHSLALKILMMYSDDKITVLDEISKTKMIDMAMRKTATDTLTDVGMVSDVISVAKTFMFTEKDHIERLAFDIRTQAAIKAYKAYIKIKNEDKRFLLDFDDMLPACIELFDKRPDVLSKVQDEAKYLLVDEFQDTNDLQYQFVKQISQKHQNLVVIGDPDQSIYGWRGSNVRIIYGFKDDFPDTEMIMLEQNYRSKSGILETANRLISINDRDEDMTKLLWSDKRNQDIPIDEEIIKQVRIAEYLHVEDEAKDIASIVKDKVKNEGKRYSDFAVLYRVNRRGDNIRRALENEGIKFTNSKRENDKKMNSLPIMYLKYLLEDDNEILMNLLLSMKNVGQGLIDKLQDMNFDLGIPFYETLSHVDDIKRQRMSAKTNVKKFKALTDENRSFYEDGQYNKIIENMQDNMTWLFNVDDIKKIKNIFDMKQVENKDYSFENLIDELILGTITLDLEDKTDAVIVMSIHQAKGLEFKNVFIVGNERDSFPSMWATGKPFFDIRKNDDLLQEERRLEYVAITRAEEFVQLSFVDEVMRFSGGVMRMKKTNSGQFIEELNERGIEIEKRNDE